MNYYRGRPQGTMRSCMETGDPRKFRNHGLKCVLSPGVGQTLVSSVISAWSDFSGTTADWTQGTAGRRPAVSEGGADFDGTDDFLAGPVLNTVITASAYTVILATMVDAVDTNTGATYLNDAIIGDGNTELFGIYLKSAPTAHAYNWDGSDDHADVSISTGAKFILTTRHGSGALGIRVNNGSEVTASSGDTTGIAHAAQMARGAGSDADCFDGKVYAAVIFDTHVADDIQRRIRKAVAARVGVAV